MNYTYAQLARVAPVQSRGALWRGAPRRLWKGYLRLRRRAGRS